MFYLPGLPAVEHSYLLLIVRFAAQHAKSMRNGKVDAMLKANLRQAHR